MLRQGGFDRIHVGYTYLTIALHKLIGLVWVHVPEETEVDENDGGSSAHTSRAMDIDVKTQPIDHLVQLLCTFEELRLKILVIEVVDREVDGYHSPGFVEANHLGPVNTTVRMVDFSLHIEDPGNACSFHLFDI